jgi:hypothetical protein
MKLVALTSVSAVVLFAGSAIASPSTINGVVEATRIFNDFTTTSLTVTNNYPSSVRLEESGYADDGVGGNFANKHAFWLSDDGGATGLDFNYGDGFFFSVTVTDNSSGMGGSEVGMNSDLFGFGFFGSGIGPGGSEIAAFGGTLPFHSFGSGLYAAGDDLGLRMIYRPGPAEFGLPKGTIEYQYQINGGGWVSSGQILWNNTEGGIPSGGFTQLFGFGAQFNNPIGGTADVTFSDIYAVPAPASIALLGAAGIVGIRRRR